MHRGLLLLDLGFGAVALSLLLGDAGPALSLLGLALAIFSLRAMRPGGLVTTAL